MYLKIQITYTYNYKSTTQHVVIISTLKRPTYTDKVLRGNIVNTCKNAGLKTFHRALFVDRTTPDHTCMENKLQYILYVNFELCNLISC